jgi:hypothetical protein
MLGGEPTRVPRRTCVGDSAPIWGGGVVCAGVAVSVALFIAADLVGDGSGDDSRALFAGGLVVFAAACAGASACWFFHWCNKRQKPGYLLDSGRVLRDPDEWVFACGGVCLLILAGVFVFLTVVVFSMPPADL